MFSCSNCSCLPANPKPSYRVRVASRRGLEFEADTEITATQIVGFDDPIDRERTMSIGMARPDRSGLASAESGGMGLKQHVRNRAGSNFLA